MELMQLKYFKTVAEKGKISEAAESLVVSAPALSTSIARLENELGMQLYNKKSPNLSVEALCLRYLSSQAVARQVLSAYMSLTSVFGMGTGGPS